MPKQYCNNAKNDTTAADTQNHLTNEFNNPSLVIIYHANKNKAIQNKSTVNPLHLIGVPTHAVTG